MARSMQNGDVVQFVDAFLGGKALRGTVGELCGRLVRGKESRDFETLTDDPQRKIVMLVGPDGLSQFLGKSGYELLRLIGYTEAHIRRKVIDEGNQFKLAVLPQKSGALLATWENTISMVAAEYPEVATLVRAVGPELKRRDFASIEREAGYRFEEVDKAGSAHPRFMTTERLLASGGGVVAVRAFLYHRVHLKELYRGDGYTYDEQGARGLQEFIIPNLRLADIEGHRLLDVTVVVPQEGQKGAAMKSSVNRPSFYPHFYDPTSVGEVRTSDYGAIALEAERMRGAGTIRPAATDRLRIALMPIDCQIGFCAPGQPLFVGGRSGMGAVEDTRRLCEFIYREAGHLTSIHPTMDTHFTYQIFHPAFLVDKEGRHPAPFSMVSLEDIEQGRWMVNPAAAYPVTGDANTYPALQAHLLHYARKLSAGGKYGLTIWPYHVLLGGVDHALMPALHEAVVYHSLLRNAQAIPQIKGGNPLTENYSIFKPEVTDGADGRPIAQRNTRFMEMLLNHDVVVIAGQAKSHCVAWSIRDFLGELLAKDPELVKRVYLLDDCSSAVVVPGVIDFTDQANEAYADFAAAGMHVVSSTTPIRDWPGIDVSRLSH